MKSNSRFLFFVFSNLVYISLLVLVGYNTWIRKVPAFFGILLLFVLLMRWPDLFNAYRKATMEDDNYSIDLSVKPALNNHVTPDFIVEILRNPKVIQVNKNDLMKTDQIGYKEEWRLGLITPDQDIYKLDMAPPSTQEILRRGPLDPAFGSYFVDQLSLKRTAILHSVGYFKSNNIAVTNGLVKPLGYSKWMYGLSTKLNPGEFINIRNIRMEDDSSFSRHRAGFLSEFLREEGFPLKENYFDGDPLTTDRGGTIVIDKEKVLIIYPRYFWQRRLIDEDGNLVDLGMDENFSYGSTFEVNMLPAVSRSLIQRVAANGYIPVVRYRSFPYSSDFMLPILDTPMSASGWADLLIDPQGKGKLFISRQKTEAEWYEMLARLKELFYGELARKDYHLLGLTKDKTHLNNYLSKKLEILKDYYIMQDWQLF